ncbi:DUF397 domain-containing protein [Streptomyces pseudoechinosporeus]
MHFGAGDADLPDLVPVRDSKTPHGPALVFPANAWGNFVGALKGEAASAC